MMADAVAKALGASCDVSENKRKWLEYFLEANAKFYLQAVGGDMDSKVISHAEMQIQWADMKHTDGEGFKVQFDKFPFKSNEFNINVSFNCLGGEDTHWIDHRNGTI